MQRRILTVLAGLACVATPVLAADLEGPGQSSRSTPNRYRPTCLCKGRPQALDRHGRLINGKRARS
jgi:hypothetical protein